MIKIHISQITKITSKSILYKDDLGGEGLIRLDMCADNYASVHYVQPIKSTIKCVVERFFGEYAYYELYTTEHTHLYMNLKSNIFTRLLKTL